MMWMESSIPVLGLVTPGLLGESVNEAWKPSVNVVGFAGVGVPTEPVNEKELNGCPIFTSAPGATVVLADEIATVQIANTVAPMPARIPIARPVDLLGAILVPPVRLRSRLTARD